MTDGTMKCDMEHSLEFLQKAKRGDGRIIKHQECICMVRGKRKTEKRKVIITCDNKAIYLIKNSMLDAI